MALGTGVRQKGQNYLLRSIGELRHPLRRASTYWLTGIQAAVADLLAVLVPAIDPRPSPVRAGLAKKLESPLTAGIGRVSKPAVAHRWGERLRNLHRRPIGVTTPGSWRIRAQAPGAGQPPPRCHGHPWASFATSGARFREPRLRCAAGP